MINFKDGSNNRKITYTFLFAVFIVFILFLPDTTTPGKFDRRCWITWSNFIHGNGISNIYNFEINYLPLYPYVLWLYSIVSGSVEGIIQNINYLKVFTLVFEILAIGYVIELSKKNYVSLNKLLGYSLFISFNVAYFYNNIFYGQIDGIIATLLFMSVYYALKNQAILSVVLFVFALNFKLQSITYAPLIFVLNIPYLFRGNVLKRFVQVLSIGFIVQVLIIVPFIVEGKLELFLHMVFGSQGLYPWVSMGAFNMWSFVFEQPKLVNDLGGVWGRSYNKIGLMLYVLFIALALFPYVIWLFNKYIQNKDIAEFPVQKVLLMGVMMALIFFYFNTQMHARYAHPVMIFAGAYALYTKRALMFGVLSVAYFLNIESSAKILKGNIEEYTMFYFDPRFISALFLFVLIYCFVIVYKKEEPL